jgi:outer membrane protein assembly factor BamB
MRLASNCVVILLMTVTVSNAAAADWTQFRGPGGQGASSESNLPLNWSDTENLAWKAELPGYGASSPIVLGDRLYVTCYSGYGTDRRNPGQIEDLTLHVVCLTKAGKIVWDEHVQPKLPESERVRDHGYAAATVATDGKHLYVFFGKTGVLKFDLQGKQLWQTSVGDKTHGWGCGTSPVLYKNLVIVNASVESGSLVAINKEDGKEAWRAKGMNASWNTPHLVNVAGGKQELVVSVQGNILGFDPGTGEQLWNCAGIPDYVCPTVVSHEGVAYVIGGRSSRAIAVRAGGRGDVTETHRLWEAKAGANVVSPVVHDGYLYWVSDRNSVAYCVRLEDGEVMYEERFPSQPYASTLVGDGKLYIVTRNGGTYVLAAKPEFKQLAHNKFDDQTTFNASPIIADGKLYLRSDKYLYCIGK